MLALDGLYSSFYFQVLRSLYQSFADSTESLYITTGITVTHMHPIFVQFPSRVQVSYRSFRFFFFCFVLFSVLFCDSAETAKFTIRQVLFLSFFLFYLVVWPRLGDPFVSQNSREVYTSHSAGRILVCAYIICFLRSNLNFLHNSQ